MRCLMNINQYTIHALAVSEFGGFTIPIQALRFKNGSGKIRITGNVTNAAKEVIYIAKNILRSNHIVINNFDIHIHFLHTDKLKDGYSWGVCAYLLLAWATEILPYRSNVAATGEIDLYGNIHFVEGLSDKIQIWLETARSENNKSLFVPNLGTDIFYQPDQGHLIQINHVQKIHEFYGVKNHDIVAL